MKTEDKEVPTQPIEEKAHPLPTVGMEISRTARLLHEKLRKAGDAVGMPSGYREFLMHLSHRQGQTQQELARLVQLSAPTVSVTLCNMERDGLIKRVPDEKDRRNIRVWLTGEGESLNKKIQATMLEVDEGLILGFTPAEQELIRSFMKRMNTNLANSEGKNL